MFVDDVIVIINYRITLSRGGTDRVFLTSRLSPLRMCVAMSVLNLLLVTATTVLRPFVSDYPGEPVPEKIHHSGFC